MSVRALNVCEKPSVAAAISDILGQRAANKRQGISRYNPVFEFPYRQRFPNGVEQQLSMTVTSVSGHVLEKDFRPPYNSWTAVPPTALFFEAPIVTLVGKDNQPIVQQLQTSARNHELLILWLDCDREGEQIGYEVLQICQEVNPRLKVQRAHFSALIPRDIHQAMVTLTDPNPNLRDAVEARQEIDLRIGAAFTRFQSQRLQKRFSGYDAFHNTISYGPCQFPTLGFVCERYLKIINFKKQPFWEVDLTHKQDQAIAKFKWHRDRLYDRLHCLLLFEDMLLETSAVITACNTRDTTKTRPVPLSTVEMQKSLSRPPFRLSSHRAMELAEGLYQKGFISYPRTETDKFKEGTDLQALIRLQTDDQEWGAYANELLNGAFEYPRDGGHDDTAHPPIHATKPAQGLSSDEYKVYSYIVRHFLACCSRDAKGMQTKVTATIGVEQFHATGLQITQKNWLLVYPYDRWVEHAMPQYQINQRFVPTELLMRESSTHPPPLLSEHDLISLMDQKGIGTDATIAQHIKTIQDRNYVEHIDHVFQPTKLGLGLVEGYDAMDLLLSQPTLRAHMEKELDLIGRGLKAKAVVVSEVLTEMKRVFDQVLTSASVLDDHLAAYFPDGGQQQALQQLQANFSRCGTCGNMCDLKQPVGAAPFAPRVLACATCVRTLSVPARHLLQPTDHQCPYCKYQVISVTNQEKQTTHTLCPMCFNNPPAVEIENAHDNFGSGFRCFNCRNPNCALSAKGARNLPNDPVIPCDQCGKAMMLKCYSSGAYYLGCSGYPGCHHKFSFDSCKDVQLSAQVCETCVTRGGFKPRLLTFNFKPGAIPPHYDNPLTACIQGCDDEFNVNLLRIRKNPSNTALAASAASMVANPQQQHSAAGGYAAASSSSSAAAPSLSSSSAYSSSSFSNRGGAPGGGYQGYQRPASAGSSFNSSAHGTTANSSNSSNSFSNNRGRGSYSSSNSNDRGKKRYPSGSSASGGAGGYSRYNPSASSSSASSSSAAYKKRGRGGSSAGGRGGRGGGRSSVDQFNRAADRQAPAAHEWDHDGDAAMQQPTSFVSSYRQQQQSLARGGGSSGGAW